MYSVSNTLTINLIACLLGIELEIKIEVMSVVRSERSENDLVILTVDRLKRCLNIEASICVLIHHLFTRLHLV